VRGVGVATAAISIVNALPTGVGSAVGVDLTARAELDLHPSGSSEKWDVRIPDASRTPLVVESLTQALRRFVPGTSGRGELTIRSSIPVGRGLKSSSAVSSAVVLAAARATETSVTPIEVARLSSQASIVAGVSATGAFDDALAGLVVGIVVTDNPRGEVLRTVPVDRGLAVALFVPPQPHPPAPGLKSRFEAEAVASSRAVRAAIEGDWKTAMQRNTELVERVMGYEYGSVRSRLTEAGAVACGVSGLGPALAAVAPASRLDEVARHLPGPSPERHAVGFSSTPAIPGDAAP
jgi:shikimate kinase